MAPDQHVGERGVRRGILDFKSTVFSDLQRKSDREREQRDVWGREWIWICSCNDVMEYNAIRSPVWRSLTANDRGDNLISAQFTSSGYRCLAIFVALSVSDLHKPTHIHVYIFDRLKQWSSIYVSLSIIHWYVLVNMPESTCMFICMCVYYWVLMCAFVRLCIVSEWVPSF